MSVCPACQTEVDEAARLVGRCPACGAALRPLAQRTIADIRKPLPEELRPHDQTIEAPPGGLLGESIEISIHDPSESPSSSKTISEPQPPLAEPPTPGAKPPTVTFGPEMTLEFGSAGSAAIDESMLTSQWEGGVSEAAGSVGATIKQRETVRGTYVSSSSLIVKSRHVAPSGAVPRNVTSPADAPDYELLNVIGEGGMGVVYAARQSSIARTVALKMLKTADADATQRDKFISEAVVTGELDHPNIVPIYDLGANDDGALFYSMKRVKGTPWHKVIRDKTLDENLNVLLRVADAVAFAHVNGVIHRDLKPENVMLGDFGEVLVMDWGLARVNSQFPNVASVSQSDAMGGTPAYMAPEMATGPLERITTASDVYLLGAILYEIITGKPPHTGKTVMSCLFSAAKNQITASNKSGELVDIALKAMATSPEARHGSVQAFQTAVRDYQAHAASLRMLDLAEESLDSGAKAQDYDLYARAVYALEESLVLWPGNARAKVLLANARTDYAKLALDKGDFDLGVSLLDSADETHTPVLAQLEAGRDERESRQRRIKWLKRAVGAMVAAVIGVVSVAYYFVSQQRDEAVAQRIRADEAREEADENFQEAESARMLESEARLLAEQETERAVTAESLAQERLEAEEIARRDADMQRQRAEIEKTEADRQREIAVQARIDEEYSAYVARIGLTKVKLDENAFDRAIDLLAECPAALRDWEWGRLGYLTQLADRTWSAGAPLETAAYSPDGAHFATGGRDGMVAIWNRETGEREHEMQHGQYVLAVAYDRQGERLASGSSDGTIRVYRTSDGEQLLELPGHKRGVLSVSFSPDGKTLLSGGYDNVARLWNLESESEIQALDRHSWWVWAAEFSADGRRIVTAGQDGKAIVWERPIGADPAADFERLTEFTKHRGPIYAARFSPRDGTVVTAGFDGGVRLWDPDEVQPIDVKLRIENKPDPPAPFRELVGHRGPVRTLAFSPDGARLASGGQDNVIIVQGVDAGAAAKELRGHASHVRSVAFSPDGSLLLSASRDQQIKLWQPAAYGETRVLEADLNAGYPTLAARFSPDGGRVVTASGDRTASLWDAQTLELIQHFQEGHDFLASSAVFFADGTRLATGAGDGTVRVWDVATGAETLRLDGTGRTSALDVSADGSLIATASRRSGETLIWDAGTGELVATLTGRDVDVTAVRFAPSGELLATGDDQGLCQLWHYNAASEAWTPAEPQLKEGHSRTITALAFVDDGARLISASGDNTCGQWDVATGAELTDRVLAHPNWVADMVATRDGRYALTCCEDGKLRLWSLADAQVLQTFETLGDAAAFTSIDLSPDGRTAAAACAAEGTVRLWNLATGEEVAGPGVAAEGATPSWLDLDDRGGLVWAARFAPNGSQLLVVGGNDARLLDMETRELETRFSPHGVVASADVSQDGSRVVTGSWDSTGKIWDAATGNVIAKLDGVHEGYVNSVAFSPDGSRILTASDDETARLWNAADGTPLDVVLRGHEGRVRQACFSPDGQLILSGGNDKTVRLWNAATGELLETLPGHEWAVRCVGFSADGRLMITGSEDNTAIVWDAATRDPVITLRGHTGAITAVALSPDGTRALTGSEDNAVKLWDAATGKEILTLAGHTDEVTAVSFSPDGLTALTSGRDGRVHLWPASDWKAAANLQAQRPAR